MTRRTRASRVVPSRPSPHAVLYVNARENRKSALRNFISPSMNHNRSAYTYLLKRSLHLCMYVSFFLHIYVCMCVCVIHRRTDNEVNVISVARLKPLNARSILRYHLLLANVELQTTYHIVTVRLSRTISCQLPRPLFAPFDRDALLRGPSRSRITSSHYAKFSTIFSMLV